MPNGNQQAANDNKLSLSASQGVFKMAWGLLLRSARNNVVEAEVRGEVRKDYITIMNFTWGDHEIDSI